MGGSAGDSFTANHGQGIAGGIFNYSGTVSLLNTIVAGNSGTNSPDLYGPFVSGGFNLIGNNQGATNLSINDFQDLVADLGPLQNNGGPTLTCVPQQGSFAIGYGTSTGAPGTDQRGVPRPQGGGFDIGAVQVVTGSPICMGGAMNVGAGFCLNTIFDATNTYRIQASTNLTNWIALTNYGTGGTQSFMVPRRFLWVRGFLLRLVHDTRKSISTDFVFGRRVESGLSGIYRSGTAGGNSCGGDAQTVGAGEVPQM
jgi:hypothetical protein